MRRASRWTLLVGLAGTIGVVAESAFTRPQPARPVSCLTLDMRPCTLAVLPAIDQVVSTSIDMLADHGAATPGVRFDRATWPHGATAPTKAHGSVFSRGR